MDLRLSDLVKMYIIVIITPRIFINYCHSLALEELFMLVGMENGAIVKACGETMHAEQLWQ